jgi:leader peptidase (prepilin peptidase)/N-methyltransferase
VLCSWQVGVGRLNGGTLANATLYPPLEHWIWLIPAFFLGACIGSFLNVVIYRLPLGLSVNEPKRSFCPSCKKPIPMWLNLPLISWLWLGGKCRECGARIAFRYFGVELLTALLFVAVWWVFVPESVAVIGFLWVMVALLVAMTFIDAEHLIIPTSLTWAGSVLGLGACMVWPQLPVLAGEAGGWVDGLKQSVIGWVIGFGGLWLVVELGKKVFGKKELKFEKPVEWSLREPENEVDPLCFVIDGEAIPWWDLFSRKTDRLLLEATCVRVDGKRVSDRALVIRESEIELADGTIYVLADIKSVDGFATRAVIPREAMGMGDVHLLGMVGAFFGASGVLFTLFSSSVFAIIAALIGRVGFGKPLPYGPFLAMGAVTWMFGAWRLWEWYLDALVPLAVP